MHIRRRFRSRHSACSWLVTGGPSFSWVTVAVIDRDKSLGWLIVPEPRKSFKVVRINSCKLCIIDSRLRQTSHSSPASRQREAVILLNNRIFTMRLLRTGLLKVSFCSSDTTCQRCQFCFLIQLCFGDAFHTRWFLEILLWNLVRLLNPSCALRGFLKPHALEDIALFLLSSTGQTSALWAEPCECEPTQGWAMAPCLISHGHSHTQTHLCAKHTPILTLNRTLCT